MSGQLFKQYFLTDGIWETPEWRESVKTPQTFNRFIRDISIRFNKFGQFGNPNENEQNEDRLRTFFLLFNRNAFVLRKGATATFLENVIEEGRRYEEKVAHDLSSVVFDRVSAKLIEALANNCGENLSDARSAALIFLYRFKKDRHVFLPAQDQVIIIKLINQNPVRANMRVPSMPVLS